MKGQKERKAVPTGDFFFLRFLDMAFFPYSITAITTNKIVDLPLIEKKIDPTSECAPIEAKLCSWDFITLTQS